MKQKGVVKGAGRSSVESEETEGGLECLFQETKQIPMTMPSKYMMLESMYKWQ